MRLLTANFAQVLAVPMLRDARYPRLLEKRALALRMICGDDHSERHYSRVRCIVGSMMSKSLSEPLDDEELERLDEFLLDRLDDEAGDRIAAAGGDEGILGLSELDGFLTAIVSGPSVALPSRWLPVVWGMEAPTWDSAEHFQEIFSLIIRHQNSIADALIHSPQSFEPMFGERRVKGKRI